MATRTGIPVYKLFGEQAPWPTPDMVHCESIAARSRLHNWQITPHRHNGLFQILHLAGGNAQVQVDAECRDMTAGQVILVPQMCIHGFRFEHDAVGHVVTLAYPLLGKLARQGGDALMALAAPRVLDLCGDEESGYLRTAFDALDAEYRGSAPYRTLQLEAVLGVMLVWLARRAGARDRERAHGAGRSGEHFARFCALVDERYAAHAPVSHYATALGITAGHLNALCRQVAGKSALALIHERMVLEAKRNLVYTSMTVALVGDKVGFSDPAYFTRFFKRAVGMSPKAFRRKAETV